MSTGPRRSVAWWCLLNLCVQSGSVLALAPGDGTCKEDEATNVVAKGAIHLQVSTPGSSLRLSELQELEDDCACATAFVQGLRSQANTSPWNPGCEKFCMDNGCPCLKPWADRCKIESCSQCPQCGSPSPAPEPDSATPSPAPEPDPCFPGVPEVVDIHFQGSTLSENNLDGSGPGPQEMRCQGIGAVSGQSIDLVIKVKEGSAYRPLGGAPTGLVGDFVKIGLGAGLTAYGREGMGEETTLTFSFQATGTTQEIVLPAFYFTFADLDQYKDDNLAQVREKMRASGFQNMLLEPVNDMLVTQNSADDVWLGSRKWGAGCDNPDDPMNLRVVDCSAAGAVDQRKRAITFLYKDRSSFEVTIGNDCNGCKNGARNFLFAAKSSLANLCV